MNDIKNYKLDTKCVHSGTKETPEGSLVTPIYQTSTFKFRNVAHGASLFRGEEEGYIYTRMRNPTIEAMEDAVAALESGTKALGCASGMAAIHTLFTTVLNQGDHIICGDAVYGPTVSILNKIYARFGVEVTFVDSTNSQNVQRALRPNTKLIHIETPGNPSVVMSDIEEIAKIAHSGGTKLSVDNTFMSPVFQQPLTVGADYVIHSMTKSLNGHADVVAGIIVLKDGSEYKSFRKSLDLIGGVIDPFNSFLVHRGLKTLSLRVRQQAENAMKIAQYLEVHPKVKSVNYPGLKSHPQYEIGLKQMTGHGSMIAIELKGGIGAGITLLDNIEVFQLAVSLGGVESLIQHPASMTHAGMGKEAREHASISDGLVRISIGIEDADDLLSALDKALAKV